jgi:hypothetical protein
MKQVTFTELRNDQLITDIVPVMVDLPELISAFCDT